MQEEYCGSSANLSKHLKVNHTVGNNELQQFFFLEAVNTELNNPFFGNYNMYCAKSGTVISILKTGII